MAALSLACPGLSRPAIHAFLDLRIKDVDARVNPFQPGMAMVKRRGFNCGNIWAEAAGVRPQLGRQRPV
jgi:hypothetical protein